MRRLTLRLGEAQAGRTVHTLLRQELLLSAASVRRAKTLPDGILLDGQPVFTNQTGRAGQLLSVAVGDVAVTVNRSGDGAAATGGPKSAAEDAGYAAGDAGFAEPHPGFTAGGGAEHAAEGTQLQTPGNARNQPGNMAAPIGFETPDDTERTALATQPGIPDNAGNLPQKPEGSPEDMPQEYLPEVENMEGAAFFAVCDALGVACCQIRAVSNYVGEPFGQWAVEEAVGNLTEKLNQIFESNE